MPDGSLPRRFGSQNLGEPALTVRSYPDSVRVGECDGTKDYLSHFGIESCAANLSGVGGIA